MFYVGFAAAFAVLLHGGEKRKKEDLVFSEFVLQLYIPRAGSFLLWKVR